ncbi:hypothetical protein [Brucella cytisi]|uniref:hypothetical protein n=1 Tax=Brucella cytisi TaxID=407152 RepID=UPI001160556E|nr:hypothetical protein [Brucella cytisi]
MRLPPVVITVLSIGRVLIFWPDFPENFHQMGCNKLISEAVLRAPTLLAKSEKRPGKRVVGVQGKTSATGLNGYVADSVPAYFDFIRANANINAGLGSPLPRLEPPGWFRELP